MGILKLKRKSFSLESRQRAYWHLYKEQNGQCALCGCSVNADGRDALDHIIPLSKGGAESMENLQIVHHRCNSKKAARMGDEIQIRLEWPLRFIPKPGVLAYAKRNHP